MYSIGVDIGTSNIKALLLSDENKVCGLSILPNVLVRDSCGRLVFNSADIWDTVLCCIKNCVKHIDTSQIKGLSISSMTEAGVPLDQTDRPLYDVIPWNDKRTENQIDFINNNIPANELYQKTGQSLHTKYPLTRLIWLRENEPAIFSQIKMWLSIGDFILFMFTGEMATDFTQAARTMLFNITSKKWDMEILDFCGIDCILPQVHSMGTAVGVIKKDVLEKLGLSGNITVYVGGHDHLVALNACKIGKRELFNSSGTSEVFAGLMTELNLTEESFHSGIAQGIFDNDSYYWMTSLPSSGASIEWFRNLLHESGNVSYTDLIKMSRKEIETDIVYLPYINGKGTPQVDPFAKGSFLNIGFNDGRAEILKAVYEGISFQSNLILETLECLNLCKPNKINVCGGGGKNYVWQSIKADILQKDVTIYGVDMQEMSVYGAALLAQSNSTSINTPGTRKIVFSNELREYYDEKYKKFLHFVSILNKVNNKR